MAYNTWEGQIKPEEWWSRFGDEIVNADQVLRLIHTDSPN
jgi:hypothetical protein